MRSSLEQMERIAGYLAGKLPPQERADFEADLAGDPLLQEQLGFQQDIQRNMQRRALRSEIDTVAKHYGGSSGFSWMAMTVSGVVVVAGAIGFLLFSSGKEQPQQTATAAPQAAVPAAASVTTAQPAVAIDTNEISTPFRLNADNGTGSVRSVSLMNMQEARAIGLLPASEEKSSQSYAFVSDFDQLDFLPQGFSNEALSAIPAADRRNWDNERLSELYYSLGSAAPRSYITVRSWRKPLRMHIPGTLIKRSDYKSKAFGIVVDDKGDPMENVTIEFLAYGDKRTVTTDANGRFSFGLYGKIATEATFTVPGYGQSKLPKAQFQTGKQTWFLVEASGNIGSERAVPVKGSNEKGPDGALTSTTVDGSCSISPTAIKALRSPEFLGTFIATKDFEKRIKALHMLDDGQELLDLYVDNITQPLWKADQLVAGRLTGESKKIFEGFSAEHSETAIARIKDQAYYSNIYRDKRHAFEQQTADVSDRKLMEHMKEFVAPCTQ